MPEVECIEKVFIVVLGSYHPFPIFILIFTLFFIISSYVVEGIALFRMGKKANISWAWVAWIPGAQNFVVSRMARWKAWALFPVLILVWGALSQIVMTGLMVLGSYVNFHESVTLSTKTPMTPLVPMTPTYSTSPTFIPGLLPVSTIVMPVLVGVMILLAVLIMIQWGQVLERFGYSYAWLMWNFLPVIGYIVFFVILFRIAFRKDVQYQDSGMRTMFGSQIRESGNSI